MNPLSNNGEIGPIPVMLKTPSQIVSTVQVRNISRQRSLSMGPSSSFSFSGMSCKAMQHVKKVIDPFFSQSYVCMHGALQTNLWTTNAIDKLIKFGVSSCEVTVKSGARFYERRRCMQLVEKTFPVLISRPFNSIRQICKFTFNGQTVKVDYYRTG